MICDILYINTYKQYLRGVCMKICYKKLWMLLIQKDVTKVKFCSYPVIRKAIILINCSRFSPKKKACT